MKTSHAIMLRLFCEKVGRGELLVSLPASLSELGLLYSDRDMLDAGYSPLRLQSGRVLFKLDEKYKGLLSDLRIISESTWAEDKVNVKNLLRVLSGQVRLGQEVKALKSSEMSFLSHAIGDDSWCYMMPVMEG